MSNDDTTGWIAAHLRACEETLLDPAVRRDRARVAEMLAEDFFEFGASGRHWTREDILDLLASEDYSPPVIEDFRCRLITEGVALLSYRAMRTDPLTGGMTVTLRSSIWSREPAGWRMRFHQGTRSV